MDEVERHQKRSDRFKVLIAVGVGLALLLASLFFGAAEYEVVTHSGAMMLLLGWMGPLGFHVGWYANPLLLAAWVFALMAGPRSSVAALILSVLAVLVGATSYYTLEEFSMFGRNEAEMAGELLGYGAAIHLWMACLVSGIVAATVSGVLTRKRIGRR